MVPRKIQACLHLFSLLTFAFTWLPSPFTSPTAAYPDDAPLTGRAPLPVSLDSSIGAFHLSPGGGFLQDGVGDVDNHPPNARTDRVSTQEGVPVEIAVLDNDHDPDSEDILYLERFQETSQQGGRIRRIDGGTPQDTSDDRLNYTPPEGFSGADSFLYSITDGELTDSADVTVTVTGGSQLEAEDDRVSTAEDEPVTLDVRSNDRGAGGSARVAIVETPDHGQAAVGADQRITYTPDRNFHGADQFRYEVCASGDCSQARVLITVSSRNDPPFARDDSVAVMQDESVTINVLANDEDEDGDSLRLVSVSQPGNGSASISDNQARYTPAAGFSGSDAFDYTIDDGSGARGRATVNLTVERVNHPPQARRDSAETREDVAVDIAVLANDHDPDSEDRIYLESFQPTSQAGGRVTRLDGGTPGDTSDDRLRYTPPAGFSGSDSFRYTVSDGRLDDSDIVSVSVRGVTPTAVDDNISTSEDQSVTAPVIDNDRDTGSSPSVRIVETPDHGQAVVGSDRRVTYTPHQDFNGMDGFTYEVCRPSGSCSRADVTVSVTPVNDNPVARDDTGSTMEGAAVEVHVLANDSDVDGDTLSVQRINPPSGGSAELLPDGRVRFTPRPGFSGSASFSYVVQDGRGGADEANVRVTVEDVEYAPVARDDAVTTEAGAAVRIPVLSNDSDLDGDAVLLAGFDSRSAAGGRITRIDSGTPSDTGDDLLLYDPPDDFSGLDTFSYTASDGELTDRATVRVTVKPASAIPVVNPDTYRTSEGAELEVDAPAGVLSNDIGDDLVAELVSSPPHGALEFNADGSFTYMPVAGFTGEDSFQYRAGARGAFSSPAAVTIQVSPRPAAPVANSDRYTVENGGPLVVPAPGVLENDSITDEVPLQAVLVDGPVHGDIQLNADGSFTYAPGPDFIGEDSFTYYAQTEESRSSTAGVQLLVPDMQSPSLSWISPGTNEERVDVSGSPVQLEVRAEDNLGVASVVFLRWDAPTEEFIIIGRVDSPPFQITVDPATLNMEWNQVFAIALDSSGNQSSPEFIWLYRLEAPAESTFMYFPLINK